MVNFNMDWNYVYVQFTDASCLLNSLTVACFTVFIIDTQAIDLSIQLFATKASWPRSCVTRHFFGVSEGDHCF